MTKTSLKSPLFLNENKTKIKPDMNKNSSILPPNLQSIRQIFFQEVAVLNINSINLYMYKK